MRFISSKNKIKRLVLFGCSVFCLLSVAASSFSVYAYAPRKDNRFVIGRNLAGPNDLFLDDFSLYEEGEEPQNYVTHENNGSIETTTYKDKKGNEGIALCLSDELGGDSYSGVYMTKEVAPKGNSLVFKMRFMVEKTEDMYLGLRFGFTKGSNFVARYDVFGLSGSYNGRLYSVSGNNKMTPLGWEKLVPGEWYTISAALNMETGSHVVRVESDAMPLTFYSSSIPLVEGNADYSVDGITIETNQYSGKLYIDYLKVEAGDDLSAGERVRPMPIDPAITATPVTRPVPFRNNVCLNGEYQYFTENPVLTNGDLLVSVAGAFRAFDLVPIAENNGLGAKCGGLEVWLEAESAQAKVNGKTVALDAKVTAIDGKYFVPLGSLARAMGFETIWNSDEKVMYITGSETYKAVSAQGENN